MQFELLDAYEIDWRDGLHRCLNDETLYAQLLSMFLRDTAFASAVSALRQQDYPAAFDYLHDLKGISANLGLLRLQEAVSPLVEALRSGKPPEAETDAQLLAVTEAYTRVCDGIRLLPSENAEAH